MKSYHKITPEGTRDLLFCECAARRQVESRLSAIFKEHGYMKVITPSVEYFDVYNRPLSAMPPESLYTLTDRNGRLLALRADNTLPIARIAATRLRNSKYPLRLYYCQSVFRRCPAFSGRSDETSQAGIELIGAPGFRADLEVLMTAADALDACGAPEYRIEIGHAGFWQAIMSHLKVDTERKNAIIEYIGSKNYAALGDTLDALPQGDEVEAVRLLPRLFGGREVLDKAVGICGGDENALAALGYIRRIFDAVSARVSDGRLTLDLGLVHGNNYYTGIIFRGYTEGSGLTVLSGGRYDGLTAEFGKALPATGFGLDVSALAEAMLDRGEVELSCTPPVLVFGADGFEAAAMEKLGELRRQGINAALCVEETLDAACARAQEDSAELVVVG